MRIATLKNRTLKMIATVADAHNGTIEVSYYDMMTSNKTSRTVSGSTFIRVVRNAIDNGWELD